MSQQIRIDNKKIKNKPNSAQQQTHEILNHDLYKRNGMLLRLEELELDILQYNSYLNNSQKSKKECKFQQNNSKFHSISQFFIQQQQKANKNLEQQTNSHSKQEKFTAQNEQDKQQIKIKEINTNNKNMIILIKSDNSIFPQNDSLLKQTISSLQNNSHSQSQYSQNNNTAHKKGFQTKQTSSGNVPNDIKENDQVLKNQQQSRRNDSLKESMTFCSEQQVNNSVQNKQKITKHSMKSSQNKNNNQDSESSTRQSDSPCKQGKRFNKNKQQQQGNRCEKNQQKDIKNQEKDQYFSPQKQKKILLSNQNTGEKKQDLSNKESNANLQNQKKANNQSFSEPKVGYYSELRNQDKIFLQQSNQCDSNNSLQQEFQETVPHLYIRNQNFVTKVGSQYQAEIPEIGNYEQSQEHFKRLINMQKIWQPDWVSSKNQIIQKSTQQLKQWYGHRRNQQECIQQLVLCNFDPFIYEKVLEQNQEQLYKYYEQKDLKLLKKKIKKKSLYSNK